MEDKLFKELWEEVKHDEQFKQQIIDKFKQRLLDVIENSNLDQKFEDEIPVLIEHFNEVIMDNIDLEEVKEKIQSMLVNALQKQTPNCDTEPC